MKHRRRGTLVVCLALPATVLVVAPLLGLVLRAPWRTMGAELAAPEVRSALWLSLVCSLSATVISVAVGLPLAWVLARHDFPGRGLLRALTTLPLILPPVVGGVALLFAFGRTGFLGRVLYDAFDLRLPFTTAGAVLAETFVAMPLVVLSAEAGFRSLDTRLEEAAATLGAGRWTTFRRVTLPLAAPAVVAGTALAWARALGEFGATVTFAGSLPGRTQTLPLAAFEALERSPEAAVAMSLAMLAVSVVVLVGLRGRWLAAP